MWLLKRILWKNYHLMLDPKPYWYQW